MRAFAMVVIVYSAVCFLDNRFLSSSYCIDLSQTGASPQIDFDVVSQFVLLCLYVLFYSSPRVGCSI